MENLPMNEKNNLFLRIKKFLRIVFDKKRKDKVLEYDKKEVDSKIEFQTDIKAYIKEKESLTKINMQNRRNDLLKKFAENPELIEKLSMEELMKLERMYDEELEQITDNN